MSYLRTTHVLKASLSFFVESSMIRNMTKKQPLNAYPALLPHSLSASEQHTFRRDLLNWYHQNARDLPWRTTKDPYRIWISEIMLQQTRVDTVIPYYLRFVEQFSTIKELAYANDEKLLKLWEGLGYYSRIRNMKKAALILTEHYAGFMPEDPDILRTLPGIGLYTAGAIASIAFGFAVPAADGNVYRVMARLTGDFGDIHVSGTKKRLTDAVIQLLPSERPGDFNQALMELGALVCLPNRVALCDACPVSLLCMANAYGMTQLLPVQASKKERRTEEKTVLILSFGDQYALHKRQNTGLLAGLWELPLLDGNLSEDQCCRLLETFDIKIQSIIPWGKTRHIFSHINWELSGFRIHCVTKGTRKEWKWVTGHELFEVYSIPSAFRFFLDQIDDSSSE
jgi:A/G-specific adenine glycosylase